MTMTAGTVSVDNSGVVTGTHLARAIYDADVATMVLPPLPVLADTTPPYTAARPVTTADIQLVVDGRILMLQDAARRATAYASALVTYMQANAVARVSTSQSLGRLPGSITTGTAIDAPAVQVDLQIF